MQELCGAFRYLHVFLPILFILSFGRFRPSKGLPWVILSGLICYQLSLFVLTMTLGHAHLLNQSLFRAGVLAIAATTTICSIIAARHMFSDILKVRYRPNWLDLPVSAGAILSGLSLYFQSVRDWSVGPDHFDSLGYHITRALLWFDQGNFMAWRTANWHHIGLPLGGDAELQPLIFLGCGWLGDAWTGLVDAIGAAVAIYLIIKSYGGNGRAALMGALAFLSFPTVGLRVTEVNTDMAAAFPVLAGIALFLTSASLTLGTFVYISLIGLGVAAKGYVLFAALPITLALIVTRWRELPRLTSFITPILTGCAVASACFLLSYLPVYDAFGSFYGGESGQRLSSYGRPIKEILLTTIANVMTWTFEPLIVIPQNKRELVFELLRLRQLYELVGLNTRWFPQLHSGENRTGIFMLLLLPWLLRAIKKGWRLAVCILFVAIFCSVTSPMSLNLGAARFALLSSAMFAILWGARATKSPFLVALFVLASHWISYDYLVRNGINKWLPLYSESIEPYRNVSAIRDGQPLLIFSRGLALDALASGRLGTWRFAYIDCPPPGMSYRDWLDSLKQQSHWIGVELETRSARYGPLFSSKLGPVCPEITNDRLRSELEAAGWRYYANVSYTEQVWRAE
jgi:hypothetical protein